MIDIGNLELAGVYMGNTQLSVYVGDVKIYPTSGPTPINYSTQYLTFEVLSAGTIVSNGTKERAYSTDDGQTWTTINTATTLNVNAGDKVLFKAEFTASTEYDFFQNSTAYLKVYGNVMSLMYGDNFVGQTVLRGSLIGFLKNTNAVDAENLILPATAITYSYKSMFEGCSSLKTPPELPATVLSTNQCYWNLFSGCTNLETAPVLPATSLVYGCYQQMFLGCEKINYIKCLAEYNVTTANCENWVQYVQTNSGTFEKNSSVTNWERGNSGVPSNWTITNAP